MVACYLTMTSSVIGRNDERFRFAADSERAQKIRNDKRNLCIIKDANDWNTLRRLLKFLPRIKDITGQGFQGERCSLPDNQDEIGGELHLILPDG